MIYVISDGRAADIPAAKQMTYKDAMMWLYLKRYDSFYQREYSNRLKAKTDA